MGNVSDKRLFWEASTENKRRHFCNMKLLVIFGTVLVLAAVCMTAPQNKFQDLSRVIPAEHSLTDAPPTPFIPPTQCPYLNCMEMKTWFGMIKCYYYKWLYC